jgi:hypothetical protein
MLRLVPLLLLLAPDARAAQQSGRPDAAPADVRATRVRPLAFDRPGDGSIWVRGRTYKAQVRDDGAAFVPALGPRAPRNHPLELALESASVGGVDLALRAAPPRRLDDAVEVERGAVVERWDFRLDSAEHSFRFDALPRRGAIELRIAWDSTLEAREDADGFVFSSALGGVRYGRATAIDAAGRTLALTSSLDDGAIVVHVPAEFVAAATLPLVVDPVVTAFAVAVGPGLDDQRAESAYDETAARWLVVHEDAFSAADFDVYSEILDANGVLVSEAFVDMTNEAWILPRVANVNASGSFLVVATAGPVASPANRHVRGRITAAATLAYGPVLDVSGPESDSNLFASVGGDPYLPGPAYFCVAWQRDVLGVRQIVYRNVASDGSFLQALPVPLDVDPAAQDAAVSKGNGTTRWNITWGRCPAGPGDCDIYAAQVQWDGWLVTPPFPLTATASAESAAEPSSPSQTTGSWMVVWQVDRGGHHDVEGALCLGGTVLARANLTALEAADVLEDQIQPSVDADGDRFVVTYQESWQNDAFDHDPYVASFVVLEGNIALAEGHDDLAYTSFREEHVSVASRWSSGGPIGRALCCWTDSASPGAQHDVRGAFFDAAPGGAATPYCFGDGTGTACPCGNSGAAGRGCAHSANSSGARLETVGSAQVSNDTLALIASSMPPTASCLFFQGTAATANGSGVTFGDGLRCVAGSTIRLITKFASAGSAQYPTGAEPRISVRGLVPAAGAVRTYQVWFRNSAPFCTAATFNLTNGLRVTWLP